MYDWRGWMCRHPSYFVGLLLKEARLPYNNYGHVVLAKPSPILFYPISSVEVSLMSLYDSDNPNNSLASAVLHVLRCSAPYWATYTSLAVCGRGG